MRFLLTVTINSSLKFIQLTTESFKHYQPQVSSHLWDIFVSCGHCCYIYDILLAFLTFFFVPMSVSDIHVTFLSLCSFTLYISLRLYIIDLFTYLIILWWLLYDCYYICMLLHFGICSAV